MVHFLIHTALTMLLFLAFSGITESSPHFENQADDPDYVIFYHSFGYQIGDEWVIPMRYYVYEYRRWTESLISRTVRRIGEREPEEIDLFRSRIRYFAVDSESREVVYFRFEEDPDQTEYTLLDESGSPVTTGLNGVAEGVIRLPVEKADQLMKKQRSDDGWLSFYAVSEDHEGTGSIQFIPHKGLSIISDIDDTVKITEIPAGARTVVQNTFFKDFQPAPELVSRYQNWHNDGAVFHYVSGAPWQLYKPLEAFLFSPDAGYPEGTFHMKNARKNLLSVNSWRDLRELATNELVTYEQKIEQITEIISKFPERRFILVGDSGERDPEVYREIFKRFPDQIEEIIIRDVVNDRELNPDRLQEMTIVPAPTIVPDAWQNQAD